MALAFLNNQYLDLQEAKISVLDRGFLFGDGIYEVIPVYAGKAIGLALHLERLYKSLADIQLDLSKTDLKLNWQEIFKTLAKDHDHKTKTKTNYYFYIQVTRGAQAIRKHKIPETYEPTVLVAIFPIDYQVKTAGIHVRTETDIRWARCRTKAITLLPNILAKSNALRHDADDSIFIKDNYALEGTSSNLFVIKNQVVYTPPLSENILPGITRKLVLDLLTQLHIEHQEKQVTLSELLSADEVWLSSSTQEVTPVISIDQQVVGSGIPGPIWQTVYQQYQLEKKAII